MLTRDRFISAVTGFPSSRAAAAETDRRAARRATVRRLTRRFPVASAAARRDFGRNRCKMDTDSRRSYARA